MGTIIRSVGTSTPESDNGIVQLTSLAAKRCLSNAAINEREIGMIIYSGVYNENHQGEPAIASLIQNSLQSNYVRNGIDNKEPDNILSFDIHNGGGGILDAFQVADGFIASGELKYGLIVTGDTKPTDGASENYNYFPSAGAALLSKGSDEKGFVRFKTITYPEFINDFNCSTNWDTGKFRFIIDQKPDYIENCLWCAEDSIKRFLEEEKLLPEEIDLIISSRSPLGFREKIIQRTGFKDFLDPGISNCEIYSAGLVFSLDELFKSGKFKISERILFLTVGSGITVSLALYRNFL